MIEARAYLADLEQTRQRLLSIGAIFVERYSFKDIEILGPSVEIETDSADNITPLLEQIGTTDLITDSMPETMSKLIKH